MPDICDLILEEHAEFRRRFAALDGLRAAQAGAGALAEAWRPLAGLLERHATAEERLFYPRLLRRGDNAVDETEDALHDHNAIRDAVRRAAAEQVGEDEWWDAVGDARKENSEHMAEEEREALADFRTHAERSLRESIGGQWQEFAAAHPDGRDLPVEDEDPDAYLRRNQ